MSIAAVSKRILVTLPDAIASDLEAWAKYQGRSTANLAAFLIELGIRQSKSAGEFKTLEDDSTPAPQPFPEKPGK